VVDSCLEVHVKFNHQQIHKFDVSRICREVCDGIPSLSPESNEKEEKEENGTNDIGEFKRVVSPSCQEILHSREITGFQSKMEWK
jgi:hypothetical protein